MERVKRIELSRLAWEARALPLSYTRLNTNDYSKESSGHQAKFKFFRRAGFDPFYKYNTTYHQINISYVKKVP